MHRSPLSFLLPPVTRVHGLRVHHYYGLICHPKTITTHKTHLMEKLGVENNAELIRYALERRLFE